MRPADEELATGIGALRDVLEDLLTTRGRGGGTGWEPPVREGIALLDEVASRLAKGDADAVSVLGRLVDALDLGSANAGRDPSAPDAGSTLAEGLTFARSLRVLALDWVQHLPARTPAGRVDDGEKDAADVPWVASRGRPEVRWGLALPAPDVPARDAVSDTATEVADAMSLLALGPNVVHRFVDDEGLVEDDDEEDPSDPLPAPPSIDRGTSLELAHLRAVARSCLEDIADLGNLRRSRAEDPWVDAEPFEERLLANLDALASLEQSRVEDGPRIGLTHALWSYATEWSVPDLGRAFAFGLCLTCLGERAAVRWALVGLRRASPRVHLSYEDALALGSNPTIDEELLDALRRELQPQVAATLLRACARRGTFDAATILLFLAHPDPGVVAAAIECSVHGDEEVVTPALVELLDGDDAASVAAARQLAYRGDARGLELLREVVGAASRSAERPLDGRVLAAATSLAMMGHPKDGPALRQLTARLPELLPALGNHGDPENVSVLIEALGGSLPHDLERAIGRALNRVLGRHPEGWRKTATTGGESRDAWQRIATATPLEKGIRARHGRIAPAGKEAVAGLRGELLDPETVQGERARLLAELAVATRGQQTIDLGGWCRAQREALLTPR